MTSPTCVISVYRFLIKTPIRPFTPQAVGRSRVLAPNPGLNAVELSGWKVSPFGMGSHLRNAC